MKRLVLIVLLLSAAAELFAPGWKVLPVPDPEAINPWQPVWMAVKLVELQGKPDTTINRDEWAYGPGQIRQAKLDDFNQASLRLRSGNSHVYTLQDCLREPVAREVFMWHCCQYPDIETAIMRWNGSGPMAEEYLKKVYSVIGKR